MPSASRYRVHQFLDTIYGDVDGLLELRATPSKDRVFVAPTDAAAVERFAKAHKNEHVYYAAATRRDGSSGKLENVHTVPAVWVDLDVDDAEADAKLKRFALRPTAVVRSGGGTHALWKLRPCLTDVVRAKSILERLALVLGGDKKAAEAARCLRVPHTRNCKYTPARLVTIQHLDAEACYTPDAIEAALPEAPARIGGRESLGGVVEHGARNDTLFKLGRALHAKQLPPLAIGEAVHATNATACHPPLDAAEVEAIISSATRQTDRADFEGAAMPVIVNLADVQPEQVDWLWRDRLALGKYTLLSGDPGGGKSTVTIDLAARLSRGHPWPDGTPGVVGRTLLLSAEDGLADTIRPRIDRAGGDPRAASVLKAIRDSRGDRPLNLGRDLAQLVDAIAIVKPALVVIDPISAYLGKTDSYKDAEVRGLLAPLMAEIDQQHVALLCVGHLSKGEQRAALHRPGGSIAFVAAARIGLCLAADPQQSDRRVLVHLKSNLGPPPPALAFTFGPDGALRWERDPVSLDAETLLRPARPEDRDEGTDADRVVTGLLEAEEWPLDARRALEAGEAHGISPRTLRRAATKRGIVIGRIGFGTKGRWVWRRPIGDIEDTSSATVSPMAPMRNSQQIGDTHPIEDKLSCTSGGARDDAL